MSVLKFLPPTAAALVLVVAGGSAGLFAQDEVPGVNVRFVQDNSSATGAGTLLMVHRLGLPTVAPAEGSGR